MEATKTPTRDYLSFTDNNWGLWETIYGRRSSRKYLPMAFDAGLAGKLSEVASLAREVRGAGQESLMVETDPDRAERIKRAAYRGIQGAINLWLLRTPVSGFLITVVPREDVLADRPKLLPATVMAAEDMVLWLTEAGLATCWLGGLNDREVRKVVGLDDEFMVPAIISIGKPKERIKARDFDNLVYRRLSRHRKPISTIASRETFGQRFTSGAAPGGRFSVSEYQDVEGLLRRLQSQAAGRGAMPLELVIEACLEAARVAPNAGNQQKWHFVAISSEEKLGVAAAACGKPPGWRAAIVGAGYPGKYNAFVEKTFWMIDLPIAFSNMSLMAASMDIACELYISGCDEEVLNRLVGLPEELRTSGVLALK